MWGTLIASFIMQLYILLFKLSGKSVTDIIFSLCSMEEICITIFSLFIYKLLMKSLLTLSFSFDSFPILKNYKSSMSLNSLCVYCIYTFCYSEPWHMHIQQFPHCCCGVISSKGTGAELNIFFEFKYDYGWRCQNYVFRNVCTIC